MQNVTADRVRAALAEPPGRYSLKKLLTLISPAAEDFLEQMAAQGRRLTIQRFGKTIQLYAPLYVSNYCLNSCLYCGFNASHNIARTRLSIDQALAEADIIAAEGFRHILLVSGRDPDFVTTDYLAVLAGKLKEKFSSISVEIYPMDTCDYQKLFNAGIDGVTLYQETYDRNTYAFCHPAGPKSDYDYRLDSLGRAASAGMRRVGVGVLLGLADWRLDTLGLAEHAQFLIKNHWRCRVSFSFPRLRPAPNVDGRFTNLISDKNLVQMMLALRLCFADAGIVLSTRERGSLRDRLVKLCVTQISAGSKTSPGGYSGRYHSTQQFQIDDSRCAAEIAKMIKEAGSEPVWKDWDSAFTAIPGIF
jgi:2-iminoacetate synthase